MTQQALVEYIYGEGDEQNVPRFEVTATRVSTTSVDLTVREVTSWQGSGDWTPAEFDPVLTVMIKWDSCAHFTMEPYLHLCDPEDFERYGRLFPQLHAIAFRLMGRDPADQS